MKTTTTLNNQSRFFRLICSASAPMLLVLFIAPSLVRAQTLAEALDTTSLTWTTGGTAPWFGQRTTTHDGLDAAQSGAVLNNGYSWIQTTVIGPGFVTFWWKVSSESGDDWLAFVIGGVLQVDPPPISGEVGWQKCTYHVPSGSQNLMWLYCKGESGVAGQDAGWVDMVSFTGQTTAPPQIDTPPLSQSILVGSTATFSVVAWGTPPLSYQWRTNGVGLSGATNAMLTLARVGSNQAGLYSVVVSNALGAITSAPPALLTVVNLPLATVWATNLVLGPKGAYPYAGIYEFENLAIGDGVEVTSSNISQLVIKVNGTLFLGSGASIRVRNGYYQDAPTTPVASVTSNNLSTLGIDAGGFRVYPGIFGRGGNGGAGAYAVWVATCDGGIPWYQHSIYNGAGGGGGGGFGGGLPGLAGSAAIYGDPNPARPGSHDGGSGGSGLAHDDWKGWIDGTIAGGAGGSCGGGCSLGTDGLAGPDASHQCGYYCGGGGGGGGNGGSGGHYGLSDGSKPRGGGGGGYGGGILTIMAQNIVYDSNQHPRLLVSGQNAGKPNGTNGEGGLLIIQSPNYIPSTNHWDLGINTFGENTLPSINGGHGVVIGGPQKVFLLAPQTNPVVVVVPPQNQTVHVGQTVTFSVGVSGTPPFTYQWSFNGTNLVGATNASLVLTNVQLTNAGQYSIVVSNAVSSATSAATLVVGNVWFDEWSFTNGQFRATLHGVQGKRYELQASTNLVDWPALTTLSNSTGTIIRFTNTAAGFPRRFYRAKELP